MNGRIAIICVILGLVVIHGSAAAFEVSYTDNGEPIRWQDRTVALSTPSHGSTAGPAPAAFVALERSSSAWNDALPEGVSLEVGRGGAGLELDPFDRVNVVVWLGDEFSDDFDSLALAATIRVYRVSSGRVIDADIAINDSAYSFSTGLAADCSDAYDMQAVLTHEIGHVLGLQHTPKQPATVMYPGIHRCEEKRTLHEDDRRGVEFLYADVPTEDPEAFGCSVAGGPSTRPPWLVGLVMVALMWRRRRRDCVSIAVVVLALCSLDTLAMATTVRRVDIAELADRSALVVRGHVIDQRVVTVDHSVYTESTIAVSECWRGQCDDRIIVRQLGGALDDVVVKVAGVGTLPTSGDVVVFLRHRRDGTAATVGLAQGVFRVASDHDGTEHLVRDMRGLYTVDSNGTVAAGTIGRWSLEVVRGQARERK